MNYKVKKVLKQAAIDLPEQQHREMAVDALLEYVQGEDAADTGDIVMRDSHFADAHTRRIPFPLYNEVRNKMEDGRKIQAIKLIRERVGVGLKQAKDFIDHYDLWSV